MFLVVKNNTKRRLEHIQTVLLHIHCKGQRLKVNVRRPVFLYLSKALSFSIALLKNIKIFSLVRSVSGLENYIFSYSPRISIAQLGSGQLFLARKSSKFTKYPQSLFMITEKNSDAKSFCCFGSKYWFSLY